MASDSSFGELWKRLRVYAPDCPLPLLQEFVNTAYSRALAAGPWSGLRSQSEFQIPAPVPLASVTVTNGSATVMAASAATAHIGRQFYTDHAPFYTIIAATPGVSYTLDRVWADASAIGTTGTVEQVYVTVPSDFLHFLSVLDNDNNWRLHLNYLGETLDAWDADRTSTGTSWIVATASPSPVSATAGYPRYEFWPRPGEAKVFPYKYIRKPALLSASTDAPVFPIRGDVLRHGALAELSQWPGTAERKNPYFNMELALKFESDFQRDLGQCAREDQELAQTMVSYPDEDVALAPLDAAFIQSHI